MNLLSKIFRKPVTEKSVTVLPSDARRGQIKFTSEMWRDLTRPSVCSQNFLELYRSIPEVFWPIDYIASRIAGANYQVKRLNDDSIVWRSSHPMNGILSQPNCLQGWSELVYQHFVYKLCTGNAFMRAAMGEAGSGMNKFKACKNFWSLPSDLVDIIPQRNGQNLPMFGIAEIDDIIKCYQLNYGSRYDDRDIPTWQVWHDRDGEVNYLSGKNFLKAKGRLEALQKPMSNIIAVYEARNVIYCKRGGLGFLVSQVQDEAGTVALTPEEKEDLLKEVNNYGITADKASPVGVTSVPVRFERLNLSISELQPFDETLLDAISIASAFGIPSVLVPRKDQSTFSNQATAEKTVYHGMIIPTAKKFCKDLSVFLGLEASGYYLDADFSDVDCLQTGRKEAEEVKKLVNDRCATQFDRGLITLNDWRAQIGEDMVDEIELFSKLKFEMSDAELQELDKIFNNTNAKIGENGKEQQPNDEQDGAGLQDEGV